MSKDFTEKNQKNKENYKIVINDDTFYVNEQIHKLLKDLTDERDLYKDLIVTKVNSKVVDVVSGFYGEVKAIFKSYHEIPEKIIKMYHVEEYVNGMNVLDWQYNYRWCFVQGKKGGVVPFPECRLLIILDPNFNPELDVHDNLGKPKSDN